MASVTTRAGKGSPLTNAEIDANFTNLNSAKLETDFSTLTDAGALDGTETLPVNKVGAKRTTVQKILDWIKTQAITWTAKQTIGGDLEFSGNARRILGEFSSATHANRTLFQASSTNSPSVVGVIPSGTSTYAAYSMFGSSDPANASAANLAVSGTEMQISCSKTGTGVTPPIGVYFDSIRRWKWATDGNVTMSKDVGTFRFESNGGVKSWNISANISDAEQGGLHFGRDGASGFTNTALELTGTGNVRHPNFTKLGESSPAIKVKKLTGTTAASQGGSSTPAHGVTGSKIISIAAVVNRGDGIFIPPEHTANAGHQYSLIASDGYVTLALSTSNSVNILSKAFTIFITYEE